jgi:glutathione synthase
VKIAFLVSALDTEQPDYTTTRLAMAAAEAGHDAFYVELDGIHVRPGGDVKLVTRRVEDTDVSFDVFLEHLSEAQTGDVPLDDLDVLMLRYEPELTVVERPWSQNFGLALAEMAIRRGVIVLNDPLGFSRATDKLYMIDLPASVRPRTAVTRDLEEAKRFIEELEGPAIVKPMQSGKGKGVFLVRPDERANVNQMLEAVARDGYLVVQEYLDAAADGDIRVLVMNGDPLQVDGSVAAVRRAAPSDDVRSNISTGGEAEPAELDGQIESVIAAVRPTLVRDGLFFVGLDVAGDKLIEVNGTSPGTMTSSQWTTGIDFSPVVIEAIERKVERRAKDPSIPNLDLACS